MSDSNDKVASPEQVVVAVTRTVAAGRQAEYEQWLSGISKIAATFPGYLGAQVLKPPAGGQKYTNIYRFNNHENAARWQTSDEHHQAVSQIGHLVIGETLRDTMTGLEVWFEQPNQQKHPTKWKMAIVLFFVVFTLIVILSTLLQPVIGNWPRFGQTAVIVAIQVCLMTYFVMPRVNKLLAKWLFKD